MSAPELTPEYLTTARKLAGRTGYMWNRLFDVRTQVVGIMLAHLQARDQEDVNLAELYNCLSFAHIPVFHRQRWRKITVHEYELLNNVVRYGTGGVHGQGWYYGQTDDATRYMQLDEPIRDLPFLFDQPYTPGRVFSAGVDFFIDDEYRLHWYNDPFADAACGAPHEYDGRGRYMHLWGCEVAEDWQYLYRHLGYMLRLKMPSSETYKEIATTLARVYTSGPSIGSFTQFMGAMLRAPVAVDVETVEVIVDTPERCIVTDRRVYPVPAVAEILVAPGDRVVPGQSMTDLLHVTELAYDLPDKSVLPMVVGGSAAMRGAYQGELLFVNDVVHVSYDNGKLRFPVIGSELDVAEFWANFDAAGGTDQLAGAVGRDGTLNPGKMILQCLSGFGLVVHIKSTEMSAPPDMIAAFLRRALDPDLVVLLHVEIPIIEEQRTSVVLDEEIEIIQIADVNEDVKPGITELPRGYPVPDC